MTLAQTDAYKCSHKKFMPENTEVIYANLTARSTQHLNVLKNRYDNKAVFFGLQHFIKEYLIEEWGYSFFTQPKEEVIAKFKRRTDAYLGKDSVCMEHFEQLHDLGYLPLKIKALPEGSRVNMRVPMFTVVNTHPNFAWLTNYLETVISCDNWKPITSATTSYEFRRLCEDFAKRTTGGISGVEFQCHDFSFRGAHGRQDAAISGAAHLLSFVGTDTIPAIDLLEDYYGANVEKEFVASSVPASEHSVTSLGSAISGELETIKRWITEDYPTGIVSVVSDTYDYFRVITEYATLLKDDILNRKPNEIGLAKVVFRPDSGNPVDIICGTADVHYFEAEESLEHAQIATKFFAREYVSSSTPHGECGESSFTSYFRLGEVTYKQVTDLSWNRYDKQYYYLDDAEVISCEPVVLSPEEKGSVECLWEIFGGTVTEQGYKLLNERVGLIYGDSITLQRAEEIFQKLEAKGFASLNVVYGVGSYTFSLTTRDCLGMAIKATYAEVEGKPLELFKDPVTDSGIKKSAKGLLRVEKEGDNFVLYDQQTWEQEAQGELKTVFLDGKLVRETTLNEIRERIMNG